MTDRPRSRQRAERQHDDRNGAASGVKRQLTSPPGLARAAGVGLSGVSIGFVVLFAFVLESGGDLTLFTRPLPMRIALALPYLIGGLTLGTAVGALLAWRFSYWSLAARIHQTLLAVLGIAFCWQLWRLGFLVS